MIYLGCAVWAFHDWVGSFYPAGSRPADFLRLYSQRLTAVEGNTTFYAIPRPATVDRWAAQTPSTFRLCPKLPRLYSHDGELMPHLPAALAFLETMQRLGPRLGPVLLQLSPRYSPAYFSDLVQFLSHWPRQEAAIAVEVRHLDWFQLPYCDRLNARLAELGVSRVLLDTRPLYDAQDSGQADPQRASARRKPRVPLQPVVTTDTCVVRYISHPQQQHNQPYWQQWISCLQPWLHQGKTVYLFIHCPEEGQSPAIARQVCHLLQAAYPDLPSLPWDAIAPPTTQLSLF